MFLNMHFISFIFFNLCLCFVRGNFGIGILHTENGENNINLDIFKDALNFEAELKASFEQIEISNNDLNSLNNLCEKVSSDSGLSVIIEPDISEPIDTISLESACNHIKVPFVSTKLKIDQSKTSYETSLNLYPEASLLFQGLAAAIESLDWSGFAILYETNQDLVMMQNALQLDKYNSKNTKNNIFIHKMDEYGDNRYLLKQLRYTPVERIVLACHVDKIMQVLEQAKEVGLLSDFSTSVFLTSLDAHTLDFKDLNTKANITTVRLFDPFEDHFVSRARRYFYDLSPEKLTVQSALMHDAMLLLAEALNLLKLAESQDAEPIARFCNLPEQERSSNDLLDKLHQITLANSLTGEIALPRGKRETFHLSIIEVYKPGKPIGIWRSEFPDYVQLTRNVTERQAELQKRLQNHMFIVSSRIGKPYLMENRDPAVSGNDRYYGYSMDLISEIARLLNITFEFRITENNVYANLATDLIERRADLAICDFTITPQRREIIDFSEPFMTLGIGILHKKIEAEEVDNMYAFLRPLNNMVWMNIGILSTAMSLTMFFIARMSSDDWENPHPCNDEPEELENIWDIKNCFWLTIGSMMCQGCDLLPKGTCTRLATASWWFFTLIIASSYTANLAAFLTMSKKDESIKSVEELAKQSKVKYGLVDGASTSTFFSTSNDSVYQKMWSTMENEKPSVFEPDNSRGVDRVLNTKNSLYAFFMESTGIEYELERNCQLTKIGKNLDSKSYGIGMPLNADYRHSINTAVLKLQESGKLFDLKEKWWKRERSGEPCPIEEAVNTDALALENVGGAFIVLGVGIGLAFLIAFYEFLSNVKKLAIQEHTSFWEALKGELMFACNVFVTKKSAKTVVSEVSSVKSSESSKEEGKLIKGSVLSIS